MGLTKGRQWTRIRKGFKSALSSPSAEASLANIEASLDQWEQDILKPLVESGEAIGLHELVGMMPITTMLNIFLGRSFTQRFSHQLTQLARDANTIVETFVHNKWAASSFYKYFDTEENRYLPILDFIYLL